jgi:hypothetical protein
MQIRELTQKKNTQVDEAIADIGGAAGGAVNMVKNVGSAIASPFKDIAQGYRSVRQDQKVSALADKAFRVWQNYVAQVEQSIAKQPATAPAKTPPGTTDSAGAATKDVAASGATTPPANGATATTTTTAKPNYGTQTGAGAKVTYKQPTGVPNPLAKTTQATSPNMMQPPAKPPATVASTAPGQTITVGGQKLKPGTKEYDQIAKATLKELQAPGEAVSPALAAFRARTDGKYEAYLRAFVQKNLLAGLGFRGLVNQDEIDNAIKAIAAPANADPAKQRPLWNDLARATSLAVPSAGALTGRDPKASKDPTAPATTEPDNDAGATTEPAKPTMTKDQISQWISRNSEDQAALKAALDAINAVKG